MDLPTCPACGQSVIDDEATECPFCGASMSGSPGAGKKAPAAAASKPKAKAKKKPAPAASKADDDNPFGAAPATTGQGAIQASPKPSKGRLHRVVCPMCDSPGFVPKKAAGREVKCANPKCMMPVFTAPKPDGDDERAEAAVEKSQPEEVAAEKSGSPLPLYIGSAVATIAVGAGVWFFISSGGKDEDLSKPFAPPPQVPSAGDNGGTEVASGGPTAGETTPPTTDQTNSNDNDNNDTTSEPPPSTTDTQDTAVAGLIRDTPEKMILEARSAEARDKAACRQLIADAFARSGRFTEAQAELDHLARIGAARIYLQADPLIAIAWEQIASDDVEAAKKSISQAADVAEKLPQIGARPLATVAGLAAAMVAVGDGDRAEKLIRDRRRDQTIERNRIAEQLAGELVVLTEFAIRPQTGLPLPRINGSNPLHTATAVSLVAHGHPAEAISWALRGSSEDAKSDSLSVVGRLLGADAGTPEEQISQLLTAAGEVSQSVGGRVTAATAIGLANAGRGDDAAKLVADIEAAFSKLEAPAAPTLPNERGIIEFRPSNAGPFRLSSRTAAEYAVALGAVGRTDDARSALVKALRIAQGSAHAPDDARKLAAELEQLGSSGLQSKLRTALELRSTNEARIAMRDYRRRVQQINEAADDRLRMQAALLADAARSGLAEVVWDVVQTESSADGDRPAEPLLNTDLPWALADDSRRAGNTELADQIEQAATAAGAQREGLSALKSASRTSAINSRPRAAAEAIDKSTLDGSLREGWAIRLALSLADAGQFDTAMSFGRSLQNPVWREEISDFVATRAASSGNAEAVQKYTTDQDLTPDERVAVMHGLVIGLLVPAEADAEPAEKEDEAAD